ncbi:MAG: hypothetical protein U1F83_09485 [Verrucomicrobiota bacterium]
MKNAYLLMLLVSVLGLTGCGDKQKAEADKVAEAARQSFATAPEPLKTKFQELKAAVEAGDFLKAKTSLDGLKQSPIPLSPEQQMAVAEQEQALMLKAATASQNGDASALKLLQAVRSERRR